MRRTSVRLYLFIYIKKNHEHTIMCIRGFYSFSGGYLYSKREVV